MILSQFLVKSSGHRTRPPDPGPWSPRRSSPQTEEGRDTTSSEGNPWSKEKDLKINWVVSKIHVPQRHGLQEGDCLFSSM